jgi:hypothetical protein
MDNGGIDTLALPWEADDVVKIGDAPFKKTILRPNT